MATISHYRQRYHYLFWLITACLLSHATTVAAADPLSPFRAKYEVARDDIAIGSLSYRLTQISNNTYQYESIKKPNGFVSLIKPDIIKETTRWQYHQDSIRPMLYTFSRTGGKKERFVEINFDWQQRLARHRVNNKPWNLKIKPDTQDKLGYLLALMLDTSRGKDAMRYNIADGGKLKHYAINVSGKETLKTELGSYDTVIVERNTPKKRTRIWLARKLGYVPVKIEHKDKHDVVYSMKIKEFH